MQVDTECVIQHLCQTCERRRVPPSPLDWRCLLPYTHRAKPTTLPLPAFGPLLRYAANNLLVPARILWNDNFNKIYPPRASCPKLSPLLQLQRRLWFTYWKTTRSALVQDLTVILPYESEVSSSLGKERKKGA